MSNKKQQNNGVGFGYRKQPIEGKEEISPLASIFVSLEEINKLTPTSKGYVELTLFRTGAKTKATMEKNGRTPTDYSVKPALRHLDGGAKVASSKAKAGVEDFDLPA